ncbi:MAG: hypothetical protein D6718_12065 [Acidobacteria bacterium]|nr:MAG: hypothetical protein D6718_12065 [Acidobacteriota bacterium]
MSRWPAGAAAAAACAALIAAPAMGADVTNPADVTGLTAVREGTDVHLTWAPVTTDAAGQPENVDFYKIYRGATPDFVPDKSGGSNQIGTSTSTDFVDPGAATPGGNAFYLVSAVDTAGNEGRTKKSTITKPPVLSGYWTDTSIELQWTSAEPADQVTGYRVYYGRASRQYEFVDDVGMATSHSLTGLETNVNWYAAVTAIDVNGNESDFSNEHVDAVGGTIDLRAMNEVKLCWGADNCPPLPGEIQRSNGQEKLLAVDFPEGDWTNITVTLTLDSRLCGPPIAPDKCGDQNPGWNPCGDPWDRTAHLFLVLDDCVDTGGSCVGTHENLELMRAITPFGTDAPPPDGSGVVPPRVLTLDITPYRPLLVGRKYLGAKISTYVRYWWVSADFHFSERPEEASPKPPAKGVKVLFFGNADPPTKTISIPASATQVMTRLFTTGHGGNSRCDGGSNDGGACSSSAECPGGSCQNCDEFCHRLNQIIVDGTPVWETVPWRDDCSPGSIFACQEWNACGWPSCTFSRAGWCPGYIACHHDAPCDQDLDMTAYLAPGGTYDVDYHVAVRTGSWAVSLVAYWY